MAKSFAERLKELREGQGMTPDEFAKIFNTNRSTIWRYETGKRQPTIEFVKNVALHFGVSMDWLAGHSDIKHYDLNPAELEASYSALSEESKRELMNFAKYLKTKERNRGTKKAQVLGEAAAGQPLEYVDSFIESTDNAPQKADYALRVKGDSMEPLIKHGSTIWVLHQPDVENGEIGIVEVDGAVTCKKIYKKDGYLELHSINPKYKPMIISKGDVRILGRVILK